MQTSDSSWSDEDREIDRLEKLVSENAADSLKWRTMFQNERDHMAAALLEIDRLKTIISEMTINQRIQDSIIAHVVERAEKAESKLAHRNGQIVMAGLKVAELEDEITRLREYCRPCDVSAADAEIGYNHVDYGYAFELSHDGTMVLKTIGAGNERAK